MEGKKKEKDFVLQWGIKKGPRAFNTNNKLKKQERFGNRNINNTKSTTAKESSLFPRKQMASSSSPSPVKNHLNNRNSDNKTRSAALIPAEKEDRYYATRGSGSLGLDENTKVLMENHQIKEETGFVWPRLFITLSSKEKEQDFMAMKGCKLPQRPKKRAKLIQKSILLVSPGAWLSDLCQERYQVREKKTSKKAIFAAESPVEPVPARQDNFKSVKLSLTTTRINKIWLF
ncbi:hypothetical protein CCACVL1_23540 [Corchorus capsularis]|uniref:Uncharacterized protein n=1 Tax=Corchorus capsularis TaxID=210143 RepID=A0A1R3GTI0_COCAP|nr:hypothetical protein CCACVL1_23540 [Corchorus capsularis]